MIEGWPLEVFLSTTPLPLSCVAVSLLPLLTETSGERTGADLFIAEKKLMTTTGKDLDDTTIVNVVYITRIKYLCTTRHQRLQLSITRGRRSILQ
ncbi:hypothetical protein V8F20_000988 [Naviculisporaceae sp. PSN 640]